MFITIIENWEDGLISTGEALQQIMSHPTATHGYMLDGIAELTLKLLKQEQAEADKAANEAFIEANYFNYSEHVRDFYIKDLPTEKDEL